MLYRRHLHALMNEGNIWGEATMCNHRVPHSFHAVVPVLEPMTSLFTWQTYISTCNVGIYLLLKREKNFSYVSFFLSYIYLFIFFLIFYLFICKPIVWWASFGLRTLEDVNICILLSSFSVCLSVCLSWVSFDDNLFRLPSMSSVKLHHRFGSSVTTHIITSPFPPYPAALSPASSPWPPKKSSIMLPMVSAVASTDRQRLFNRIAPAYDNVSGSNRFFFFFLL